jgi:hypothetical protein
VNGHNPEGCSSGPAVLKKEQGVDEPPGDATEVEIYCG